MITFKQFVAEIADSKVKYEVLRQSATAFGTEAKIGDRVIRFTAIRDQDSWDVAFAEIIDHGHGNVERDYGLTGGGKAFEVAGFVKDSFTQFLNHYQPRVFSFSAEKDNHTDDNTRARIYVKLLKPLLKDYMYEKNSWDEASDVYVFTRKD